MIPPMDAKRGIGVGNAPRFNKKIYLLMNESNLAGIISGAGSALSGIGNFASTLLTNRANMKLAQYSFDQQRQMIEEQNKYNSPVEQMKRYEEAGLNPALIYGNGQSSAGNQSTIAKYEAPTMQAPDVNLGLSQALQMALAFRQNEADVKLKENQAYAQKMLGMGYEQDAYQKQINSAILGLNAGLSKVPGIWSNDELDEMRKGNIMRKYDAQTLASEIQIDVARAEEELKKSSKAKNDWWMNNLGPALVQVYEANAQGKDIANEMAEIEKSAYEALSAIGGTGNAKSLANLFVQVLKAFIISK